MSLRIVSGRSGSGKSTLIHHEIVDIVKEQSIGAPIFLLVPDQMSFSSEYDLTHRYGVSGLIRAQVTTFKRLAWRVLQETGGISRQEINGFGYRMLIKRLLEDNKEQFSLFRQAAGKRGFTDEMETLLKEFNRYSLDSKTLELLLSDFEGMNAPQTLRDKAHDLQLLLSALEERLGTTYIDSEGYFPLLTAQLKDSEIIQSADIYIDGFTAFTTREFELVQELLKVARRVTVVLPMESDADADDEQALFYQSARTSVRLKELAFEEGIEVERTVHCQTTFRFQNNDLKCIEEKFDLQDEAMCNSSEDFEIIEAVNRRAEVHAIARKIREFMQNDAIRYREMAILYRQADVYDPLFATIFPQYDIPVFVSQKKPMLHHPLIELSRSALEVIQSDWKYEPIFRAVKTDLFFPVDADLQVWRERADRLENFVIAQGIYSERWFDENRWLYKKYRGLEFLTKNQTDEERAFQQEIEAARSKVREPLKELENQLTSCKTGRDFATALFNFIENLEVYEKLQDLKDKEIDKGQLLAASEHEQAWNQWVDVLDQFVMMFGEQEMTLEEALHTLEEGFDTLEFSRIPPSLDQVTIATADLSRLTNMKAVFVIGMNEGVYPQRMDHEGLLSDAEREWFMQLGMELAPTSKTRLLEESFITYRALTMASEKLVVSYAIADEESKALLPSLYVKKLQQLIPNAPFTKALIDPTEALSELSDLPYINHPNTSLAYLMMQLRQAEHGKGLTPEWRALQAYYEEDPYWSDILERLMRPLTVLNKAEQLTPDITDALYGSTLTSSVSRIEKFYGCPFSHFSTYGLRLEERAEYRLETPTIGDLFHAALKWISEETHEKNIKWGQLTPEQCADLAKRAVDKISPLLYHQILMSTSRYRYIQRKLTLIVQRTMLSLSQHARVSNFKPIALEAAFGPGEPLPPLMIKLDGGKKMQMRGRIDRVDATTINDKPYIRVVDYKSSSKKLDLNDVYYGLSLQMLTYLDVAVENSEAWLPLHSEAGGVLYIHVHNPMLKPHDNLDGQQAELERLKEFKMKGLLLDDRETLIDMDEALEEGGHSQVVPVYVGKKDGTVSPKMSSVISTQDMGHLRNFVRHKHQQAGEGILAGHTDISPYRMKTRTACEYCSFKSVCQFDTTDANQHYRYLQPIGKKEDVIEQIRKETKADEGNSCEAGDSDLD
ncbi:helicase-exonuclease AddAB subunit AddB [Viridibacillus sp. FSL R5-0477]|uniref:ATP-dependent helicase/deoxyribonuclease subunit B n=1 Tax=Viridibacillus arenosi FSL R5-213 TaxID=1227360 RepID=W4F4Q7_9BACL|nr:helicase-exonuclease AddAB subunit AddB [Viridibacillus arenosi]ETT87833.1 ATP-dependent nuclease subunit B [Viridibacillus arenosi FSL R5-213]OMC89846.1 helicase-exonuclease AddAB subunit AddB [Viridibacillus arenosi]